ncbi:glycosyltransferase [Nostoc linckia FACHB-104]|nr:glycosyltransferase [Nostoc linckia FACHB-104]
MNISVMITTKNRVEDLQRTCEVLQQLNPSPYEVLITADGCSDDTVNIVKHHYSQFKLIINETGQGSVASRAKMMQIAQGDLVLALDDDSYPEQLDCISRLIQFFESRPNVAVVHFPQRTDEYPETLGQTEFGKEYSTRSFANSGACLRRDIYLQLPGFEGEFFHMYEEPDYALQCVGAGYEVLLTPIITIRHHYSTKSRASFRGHHQHARNEFWSTVMRCPMPQALLIVLYRIFSQARFITQRQGLNGLLREPVWWWQAMQKLPYFLKKRQPLSWERYSAWLSLP